MKGFKRTAAAVLVAGLTVGNVAQAGTLYNIMDLGTLGGNYSHANAINASGQVTGYSGTVNNDYTSYHAFVTNSGGVMSDLGTLIYGYGFHGNSEGYGINASGQVTGKSQTGCNPGFCPPETAFITYKDLPPGSALKMPIGLSNGFSSGINDSGQLTGGIQTIYGFQSHAFITSSSGAFTDLGALNGGMYSAGYGINASGRVTGSLGYGASAHAFITDTNGIMSDLGTLNTGKSSIGYSINASGQVTGWANVANGNLHAFITNSSGIMSDLGVLDGVGGSIGYGINDYGQVVGTSNVVNEMHAFVTENGSMKDLNSLMVASVTGWVLNEARGINDAGQITGTGTYNGMTRAFVLTPVSAVPEPAPVWLFTSGLGLFAFSNRRKAQGNLP